MFQLNVYCRRTLNTIPPRIEGARLANLAGCSHRRGPVRPSPFGLFPADARAAAADLDPTR